MRLGFSCHLTCSATLCVKKGRPQAVRGAAESPDRAFMTLLELTALWPSERKGGCDQLQLQRRDWALDQERATGTETAVV